MAETVTRQALRETATALRLNRPILATLIVGVALAGGWLITGQLAWGGVIALGAAVLMFAPLFLWNLMSVTGKRLMAVEAVAANPAAAEASREVRERRRKLIDDARLFVANYELQVRHDWPRAIRYSSEFGAIRPHLSPSYINSLSSDMTVVTGNEIHEISVEGFVRELDRLEREWNLS